MAQLVECLTPAFDSGHDLKVVRSSPVSGSVESVWSWLDFLSPSAPSLQEYVCTHSLSLSLTHSLTHSNKLDVPAWVAQLVDHLTLNFDSGHDFRFVRLSPQSAFTLSEKSA